MPTHTRVRSNINEQVAQLSSVRGAWFGELSPATVAVRLFVLTVPCHTMIFICVTIAILKQGKLPEHRPENDSGICGRKRLNGGVVCVRAGACRSVTCIRIRRVFGDEFAHRNKAISGGFLGLWILGRSLCGLADLGRVVERVKCGALKT